MLKSVCLLICSLLMVSSTYAHDSCACSGSKGGVGLLSNFRNNNLSLSWYQSAFRSTVGYGEPTQDRFSTVELSMRYLVHPRLSVSAFLPYQFNLRQEDNESISMNGLSDIRLNVDYIFVNNPCFSDKAKIYFDAGLGVQAPTGKYDALIEQQHLPDNFNPGRGSWAVGVRSTFIFTYSGFGVLVNGSYWKHGKTSTDMTFGEETNVGLWLFGDLKIKAGFKISPYLAVNFEKVNQNLGAEGFAIRGTGGEATMMSFGANVELNEQFIIGGAFLNPLQANYSDGEIEARSRMTLNLTYLF